MKTSVTVWQKNMKQIMEMLVKSYVTCDQAFFSFFFFFEREREREGDEMYGGRV